MVDVNKLKIFIDFFEEQVERVPRSIAVTCKNTELTYKDLNEKTNQLGRELREKGVKPNSVVGIVANRSINMLIGILAIYKAGGAYLPVDPSYPEERIRFMLENSGVDLVLTESNVLDNMSISQMAIDLDKYQYIGDSSNLEKLNKPDDLAYIIYTSGTTGQPKGAMVEHAGMINHMEAKVEDLQLNEESVIAQNASHCFDISVWQFLAALIVGGKTIIYTNELVTSPIRFLEQVISDDVTILEVVPSLLALMLDQLERKDKKFRALKYLIATGELLRTSLVERWFLLFPEIKMVNAYGPTEASDDITHYIMNRKPELDKIPIGKPLRNLNIYIVNEQMKKCDVGVKGEIWVSGIGVGRGYINNPQKTKEAFIEDLFMKEKNIRLYKTGDFGCWLPDGNIEYFGRMDNQVKIRGHRIEMDEIESRLLKYDGIKEAAVVIKESDDNKYLCAYITSDKEVIVSDIRNYLLENLPSYMIPEGIIQIEKLPLTPNGKVDRKYLSENTSDCTDKIAMTSIEEVVEENSIEYKIRAILKKANVLPELAEQVSTSSSLSEIGINSLTFVKFVVLIEEEFDIEFDDEGLDLSNYPTLQSLIEYVQQLIS
jgi:amino acid adenylation domain-containing protein